MERVSSLLAFAVLLHGPPALQYPAIFLLGAYVLALAAMVFYAALAGGKHTFGLAIRERLPASFDSHRTDHRHRTVSPLVALLSSNITSSKDSNWPSPNLANVVGNVRL